MNSSFHSAIVAFEIFKNEIPKLRAIAEWKEEFKSEPIDFYTIEDDDVQAIITDFIMYKEVDVLIMLPYKRGFFEGLFHTSLTKKLATDFEIPILSIPINE